jgi:hypothetical protein
MRRLHHAGLLSIAAVLILPGLALGRSTPAAGPSDEVSASHIGGALLLCGQVTDYTPPDGVATDGALIMTGVSQPDPHSFVIAATAAVSGADSGLLTAIAGTDSFTCLNATGDGMAILVELAIAPSAEFCGTVEASGSTWMLTATGFPDLTTVLTAEAEAILDDDNRLDDLLAWFDQFDNPACLTFSTDASGIVDGISLDGELRVCGAVADTSASTLSAVLEYGTGDEVDLAIRPDIVGLGGIILPASIFTDAALGLMELAYAAQNVPGFGGSASVCALVPVSETEILPASLTGSTVTLCGWIGHGALTVGLIDAPQPTWTWFALLFDGLLGYPGANLVPNFTQAVDMGDPACVIASVEGGAADEAVVTTASLAACVGVVSRSATSITLRAVGESATWDFQLTAGSAVDPSLVPGFVGNVRVEAQRGLDGAVAMAPVGGPLCAPAPLLPDTAISPPGRAIPAVVAIAVLVGLWAAAGVGRRRRSA